MSRARNFLKKKIYMEETYLPDINYVKLQY